MSEAIQILKKLRDKIEAEKWNNDDDKRSVLTGIKMCIAKLENEIPDDRYLQDVGY